MTSILSNPVLVCLFLSLTFWHSTHAMFDKVGTCDDDLIKEIVSMWKGKTPRNIIQQWNSVKPWSVLYASKGLFPTDTKSVVMDDSSVKVIKESGDPLKAANNWKEEQGMLKDNKIKWYVVHMKSNALGFYICSTEGTPGTQTGAVALAMGPPGGIPEETKEAVDDIKGLLTSVGIDLEVELDLSSG